MRRASGVGDALLATGASRADQIDARLRYDVALVGWSPDNGFNAVLLRHSPMLFHQDDSSDDTEEYADTPLKNLRGSV